VTSLVQQDTSSKKRFVGTIWFWIVMAIGAIVAICAIAAVADAAVYFSKVHYGVSVYGVNLAGQTRGDARGSLSRLVNASRTSPITLKSGDKTWTLLPDDVGTAVDVNGAVDRAMAVTRENNLAVDIVNRFELFFDPRDLPLAGVVDQAKLDAFVSSIATELHVTPSNAMLAIENATVKVIADRDGQDVDQAALRNQLQPLLVSLHNATVEVPLVVTKAAVQVHDNQAAQEQVQTMLGSPITLTNHDKSWTLTPAQIASFVDIRMENRNGVPTLAPSINEGELQLYLQSLAPDVKVDPVNASIVSGGGKPKVIAAVTGEALDVTATAKALEAIALEPAGRTLEVTRTVTEPDFTTAEAQAESFNDKLSSYTTKYACPANRATNVRITTQYATDVFLAPGQEYNFDRQIGPRTAARGYKLAPGIVGPNTLEDVLGGGICQVSTTTFNAVFEAGLKVTERHNHSIYINHYPKGRDATVTGGGKNLRFVNDTAHYIWIRGSSDGTTTTITIYGTSDGRKVTSTVGNFYNVKGIGTVTVNDPTMPVGTTKVLDPGQVGRQLKTTRLVVAANGTVLHNDTWISTWQMFPKQVAVGTKPTTPTPTT
jgi:vancomycin resistance protein YoaR